MTTARARAAAFCSRYGLRQPILLAPMAGACPPALSAAIARAGGLGACGALLYSPVEIRAWADDFRRLGGDRFQMNLWIPDPAPLRDAVHEARLRAFLAGWGPPVPDDAAEHAAPHDFAAQCAALLESGAPVVSSIMGLYPAPFVAALKQAGIAWFATATTVAEARAAAAAGADAIIAQGMEAGGHRGAFDQARAEVAQVGLLALLPAVADAVQVPVIAAGAIADGRAIAAALTLGASAVQIGTGFLRCPEAGIAAAWADALAHTRPEDTVLTRAFSGRAGRAVATAYARAAMADTAPRPAPYPVQRALTAGMRNAASRANTLDGMQAWAGQGAALARALPAAQLSTTLWQDALTLLP